VEHYGISACQCQKNAQNVSIEIGTSPWMVAMMKNATVILKINNFRYRGEIVSETDTELILKDIKLATPVTFLKSDVVIVRGDF
jgi:hypothetical protein